MQLSVQDQEEKKSSTEFASNTVILVSFLTLYYFLEQCLRAVALSCTPRFYNKLRVIQKDRIFFGILMGMSRRRHSWFHMLRYSQGYLSLSCLHRRAFMPQLEHGILASTQTNHGLWGHWPKPAFRFAASCGCQSWTVWICTGCTSSTTRAPSSPYCLGYIFDGPTSYFSFFSPPSSQKSLEISSSSSRHIGKL